MLTFSLSLDPTGVREASRAHRYLNSKSRRILELLIALVALAALIPLFCVIGILIRLTSPGAVLFRQIRSGRNMVQFEILKFRSMYTVGGNVTEVKQVLSGDQRITPLGRVLRRTSMDELPQLISVIKGDMSLIGPRPHAVEHDNHYRRIIPQYCDRFIARPGITGLAQISGARGPTLDVEDMVHRVNLDLAYLKDASPLLDLQILLKTIKEMFASGSAF